MVYYTVNKDIYPVLKPEVDQATSLRTIQILTEDPAARCDRLRIQRSHAASLFLGLAGQRFQALFTPETLHLMYPSVHSILYIRNFRVFTLTLRRQLVQRYSKIEEDISGITKDCAEGLYEEMAGIFRKAADALQTMDVLVKIRSLSQAELSSHHPSLSTLSSIQSVDTSGPIPLPRGSSVPTKRKRFDSLHVPLSRLPRRARGVSGGQGAGPPSPNSPDADDRPTKTPRLSESSLRRSPRFLKGQTTSSRKSGSKKGRERGRQ